ncbi:MAG: guanylate kinase [Eggerthellaceae bacterium]|nr:guanylate kinase [Eggerthellaceae bacterium]
MAKGRMDRGNLFVISGPSGVGKGTIVQKIVDRNPGIWVSRSSTTRGMRPGDVDGHTYDFLDRDTFLRRADNGEFLEWAEYGGNLYGTPRALVEEHLASGDDVILEIEVQGAALIKEQMPEAVLVFIEPPSMDELERRLRKRNTDADEVIKRRMETAKAELARKGEYEKLIVNDELDQAVDELGRYVLSKRRQG